MSNEKFIQSKDATASFLYDLLRDHVTVGTVEMIVQDMEESPPVVQLQGPLGELAIDLANRLHAITDKAEGV